MKDNSPRMAYCEHCHRGFIPKYIGHHFFCSDECKELSIKKKNTAQYQRQKIYWLNKLEDIHKRIQYLKRILGKQSLQHDADFRKLAEEEMGSLQYKKEHIIERFLGNKDNK